MEAGPLYLHQLKLTCCLKQGKGLSKMLSKHHSCLGVFAANNKSWQQVFSCTQISQILLTIMT